MYGTRAEHSVHLVDGGKTERVTLVPGSQLGCWDCTQGDARYRPCRSQPPGSQSFFNKHGGLSTEVYEIEIHVAPGLVAR